MADLITLEEYKDAEGLSKLDDDTRLTTLIGSVSQLVKTYCGRTFVDYFTVDKIETISLDYNTSTIQLRESPLVSITTVEERTSYSSAYSTLTTGAFEYYLDDRGDSLVRTTSAGYAYWATGPGAIKVTYKAGYAAAPADLKLAVIDMVRYYFKDEYKERKTLASASINNNVTSTQAKNIEFPDHIRRVLDLYKYIEM